MTVLATQLPWQQCSALFSKHPLVTDFTPHPYSSPIRSSNLYSAALRFHNVIFLNEKKNRPWFIPFTHNLTGTSRNLSLIVFSWLPTASEISCLNSGFKSHICVLNVSSRVLVKARFPSQVPLISAVVHSSLITLRNCSCCNTSNTVLYRHNLVPMLIIRVTLSFIKY